MALSSGLTVACADENRRGGIKRLWITERDNVTDFTVGASHDYSAVTLTGTTVMFYLFEFDDFKGGLTSEGSIENGSNLQDKTLEFSVPKMTKAKAATLQTLFDTCKVIAVIEDFNGLTWVAGYDETLEEKAALRANITENMGTDLQDANGYTLTLTGRSAELTREFTGSTTDATIFEQP